MSVVDVESAPAEDVFSERVLDFAVAKGGRRRTLLGRRRMTVLKILVGATLLTALYTAFDWRQVGRVLLGLDPRWLAVSLSLFLPQTLLSAIRWQFMVRRLCRISVAQAAQQTLAASALNLALPSKAGDLSKAAMLPLGGRSSELRCRAMGLAVGEKLFDVGALLAICSAGALGATGVIWLILTSAAVACAFPLWGNATAHRSPSRDFSFRQRGAALAAMTWCLWMLHLAQIDCFLRAAGVVVSWPTAACRISLAIFAGLIPISFCGLGLRDSALIALFSDVAPPATMAAVGLLTALRYVAPGAAGIPLVSRAFAGSRDVAPP